MRTVGFPPPVEGGSDRIVVSNPSNYYVSLYTTEYPDGALRGQLTS